MLQYKKINWHLSQQLGVKMTRLEQLARISKWIRTAIRFRIRCGSRIERIMFLYGHIYMVYKHNGHTHHWNLTEFRSNDAILNKEVFTAIKKFLNK